MQHLISMINSYGQAALTLSGVGLALVSALQATRWGNAKAVQASRDVIATARDVARTVVAATAQVADNRAQAGTPMTSDEKKQHALDAAAAWLPGADPAQLDHAIEAAVADRKAGT